MRIVLAVLAFAASFSAFACSCVEYRTPEEAVVHAWNSATAVVAAEAFELTEKIEPTERRDAYVQRTQWRVTQYWKGPHALGTVLSTEANVRCCLCGERVAVGEVHLLYLSGTDPYPLSMCSVGGPIEESRDQTPILDRLSNGSRVPGT